MFEKLSSRNCSKRMIGLSIVLVAWVAVPISAGGDGLERISYNHPGLVVDLGVGLWAWPMPMDYDKDGDMDLVVVCPDKPSNGAYFFENPGGQAKMPVFKPGVRISDGPRNAQVSYVAGRPRVLTPGYEYPEFLTKGFASRKKISVPGKVHTSTDRIRANQWKVADYDGDGLTDLIVGIGDWSDYGWDDAFDRQGKWTRGPLHGYVYFLRNVGSEEEPAYDKPARIQAHGKDIDVFGMPSPNFADFDGDGDLDLICGEFLDGFTYFENIGSRKKPAYAKGQRLGTDKKPIRMDLQMITPVAVDWDGDGDVDLICGDEDGRVVFIENTGELVDRMPRFLEPRYFKQQAADVKFGALVTPISFDWDGDGDEDLICGNTAGYAGFIENLDGGNPPKWAAPRYLTIKDPIRIRAGKNGSIQGPCEAKWGYTTLSVADWNHDGLSDLVANSIWGRVIWYQNVGSGEEPQLVIPRPVRVEWPGKPPKPRWNWWDPRGNQLATQWRTTPVVIDWTGDGLNDLVMLDHEGYLALYERVRRDGKLKLLPPKRVFRGATVSGYDAAHRPKVHEPGLLRLNVNSAGKSGRRKFCFADWDGDGRIDILINSKSANFLRNVGEKDGVTTFEDIGPVDDRVLAGHTTSPTTVDWNKDGRPDLLLGAEDGYLYYLENPYGKN